MLPVHNYTHYLNKSLHKVESALWCEKVGLQDIVCEKRWIYSFLKKFENIYKILHTKSWMQDNKNRANAQNIEKRLLFIQKSEWFP